MNEISILMHLLSRRDDLYHIGATEDQLLEALNITYKNRTLHFQSLITELSKIIEPIGLQIRFNPLNSHWYITFEQDISNIINSNPFGNHPSLAATLFCVLACCLKNSGFSTIREIQKFRRKKTILEDIKSLQHKGYINYDKKQNQVCLTPLIGYQLDLEKLFIKLSLKLKEKEEKK
ncbi:MAG: hypothetical protein ACFE9P_11370 [Candidatus Hermodarchaeota archaeon]